mmetsp:Transcript_30058/g.98319  ORF Transcript_30058/g.98319 Transcript_30058/m.98319 type:complete len:1432 (+) Transcript_30058:958-5253(+)
MAADGAALLELDEVLRVRLRVVVGDEDLRVGDVVDRRVEEEVPRVVADVGREAVADALAVLADDDAAEKDGLDAVLVGLAVERVRGVGRVAREVDALAEEGRVLAAEGAVEALLEDLGDDVARRAVEEPAADVLARRRGGVGLARDRRRLLDAVGLPERDVLHALDGEDVALPAEVVLEEEDAGRALELVGPRVELEVLDDERVLDLVPVLGRRERVRAAAAEGLLQLGELLGARRVRVGQGEPAGGRAPVLRQLRRRRAVAEVDDGAEAPAVVALLRDLDDGAGVDVEEGLVVGDVVGPLVRGRGLAVGRGARRARGQLLGRVARHVAPEAGPRVRLRHLRKVDDVDVAEPELGLPRGVRVLERRRRGTVVGHPERRLDVGVVLDALRRLLPVPPGGPQGLLRDVDGDGPRPRAGPEGHGHGPHADDAVLEVLQLLRDLGDDGLLRAALLDLLPPVGVEDERERADQSEDDADDEARRVPGLLRAARRRHAVAVPAADLAVAAVPVARGAGIAVRHGFAGDLPVAREVHVEAAVGVRIVLVRDEGDGDVERVRGVRGHVVGRQHDVVLRVEREDAVLEVRARVLLDLQALVDVRRVVVLDEVDGDVVRRRRAARGAPLEVEFREDEAQAREGRGAEARRHLEDPEARRRRRVVVDVARFDLAGRACRRNEVRVADAVVEAAAVAVVADVAVAAQVRQAGPAAEAGEAAQRRGALGRARRPVEGLVGDLEAADAQGVAVDDRVRQPVALEDDEGVALDDDGVVGQVVARERVDVVARGDRRRRAVARRQRAGALVDADEVEAALEAEEGEVEGHVRLRAGRDAPAAGRPRRVAVARRRLGPERPRAVVDVEDAHAVRVVAGRARVARVARGRRRRRRRRRRLEAHGIEPPDGVLVVAVRAPAHVEGDGVVGVVPRKSVADERRGDGPRVGDRGVVAARDRRVLGALQVAAHVPGQQVAVRGEDLEHVVGRLGREAGQGYCRAFRHLRLRRDGPDARRVRRVRVRGRRPVVEGRPAVRHAQRREGRAARVVARRVLLRRGHVRDVDGGGPAAARHPGRVERDGLVRAAREVLEDARVEGRGVVVEAVGRGVRRERLLEVEERRLAPRHRRDVEVELLRDRRVLEFVDAIVDVVVVLVPVVGLRARRVAQVDEVVDELRQVAVGRPGPALHGRSVVVVRAREGADDALHEAAVAAVGREEGVGGAEHVARLEAPLRDRRGVDHRAAEPAALAAPRVVQEVLHRVAPARRAVDVARVPRRDDLGRGFGHERDLVDVEARLREAREEDVVGRGRVGRPEDGPREVLGRGQVRPRDEGLRRALEVEDRHRGHARAPRGRRRVRRRPEHGHVEVAGLEVLDGAAAGGLAVEHEARVVVVEPLRHRRDRVGIRLVERADPHGRRARRRGGGEEGEGARAHRGRPHGARSTRCGAERVN